MAGLLGIDIFNTPGINPEAEIYRDLGLDPEKLRRQKMMQQLVALGTGIASGNNWTQGLTRGLQGFSSVGGDIDEDAYRRGILGLQYQQMKKSMEPPVQTATLSPEEAASLGLPGDRVWQRDPDGSIKEVYKPDKPEKEKPIFQPFKAPGGIEIPRVSYDGGYTWQDMTIGGPRMGGGGMAPMDAILSNETGGMANPATAVSPAGALGKAQMLPDTFAASASKLGIPPQLQNPFNSGQSVAAGTDYYKQQQDTFQDPVLAAGAYHAGPGNMKAYLAQAGYQQGMDYGTLIGKMRSFAPKTADYMEKFIGKTQGGVGQVDYSMYAKPNPAMATIETPEGETITIGGDVSTKNPLVSSTKKALETGRESVQQAQEAITMLQVAGKAAERFPQSGIFGPMALKGERALNFLGLSNNAQPGEILNAMNTKLAALSRIPGSGSTSDYEFAAYQQSAPSLGNSPEGNKALVEIGVKLLKRRIANFNKWQQYLAEHNGTDIGYVPDDSPILDDKDWDLLFGTQQSSGKPNSGQPVQGMPEGWVYE